MVELYKDLCGVSPDGHINIRALDAPVGHLNIVACNGDVPNAIISSDLRNNRSKRLKPVPILRLRFGGLLLLFLFLGTK